MTRIIDMNKRVDPSVLQSIQTPKDFQKAVCANLNKAVGELAQKSKGHYALNDDAFLGVLSRYLEKHPEQNNPFNLVLKEKHEVAEARFYDLSYRIEPWGLKPSCFSTPSKQNKDLHQGVFAFVPELGREVLLEGRVSDPYDTVKDGLFAYVPQTGKMELVDGVLNSRSRHCAEIGKFEYIAALGRMEFVDGMTKLGGGVTYSGKRVYDPKLHEMRLVSSTDTSKDGVGQQGASASKPPLPTLVGRPLAPITE